ncbi:hypothetical protein [Jeotgalicoccus sp. S0W5]|uniref:hypothetical protein n=1 Tax=Jeotgalicoccus sp. S0W5 TaxID=2527874 RepID=UPI0014152E29|nr:hypothetical protein [Jeotgalicoccus sp. S0W5]
MRINELKYNSSYVISEWNLDSVLSQFKSVSIEKIKLYYDEAVDITQVQDGNDSITMIGYCFDIRDGNKDSKDILLDILNTDNLEEELDFINGRYNFIIQINSTVKIYSDASQLRPLVYHEDSKTLASHDSLLKEILAVYEIEVEQRSPGFHTELDFTRFKDIYKFNPSLFLDYTNFEFTRFYPRENLIRQSSQEVFKEMKPYLDQSRIYLENINNDKFVSVTAGIDSRVSAALTRDFSNEMEYLTYTQSRKRLATKMAKKIYKIDEKITTDMRDYLGWNHSIIKLSHYTPSKDEIKELNKIYNSKHAYALANYYKNKKYNKAIHVKSTVFGMGKADFPSDLDQQEDTFDFYKKCVHGLPQRFFDHADFDQEVEAYFERNLINEGVTKGRHYFDLFHLESRMGNWHSMLTLETDPETEEFIFTNCRKMIDFIQSPPTQEKRDFDLYKEIIENYWPVLLQFGINSASPVKNKETLTDEEDHFESLVVNKVKLKEINKTVFNQDGDSLIIKPDGNLVNIYDSYSFSLEHEDIENNSIRTITLNSFYRNTKAKNKINVIVKQENDIKVYDILDLNKGIDFSLGRKPLVINIVYMANFTTKTWVDAGRIKVDIK